MMKKYDNHAHLRQHIEPVPPHSLRPVIETAKEKGVVVGIREHAPLPRKLMESYVSDYGVTVYDHEIEPFFKQFQEMNYPVGFELDYISGVEDETISIHKALKEESERRGLEVSGIHGSVHFMPAARGCEGLPGADIGYVCWDLDENVFRAYMERRHPKQFIYDYFGSIVDLTKMGIYDALSHLELARKFDRLGANGKSVYFGECEKLYDELARGAIEAVSEAGMALELNTAGLFRDLARPYLSEALAKYALELEVPICLGSDAHRPQDIGAGFETAEKMLADIGVASVVGFEKGNRVEIPLNK
ncbi:MAG TPA: histidinol-phosphatase HisJ family protein [bacterium]|nr:histidinol-phosphatase HisJ family protein [bacterium]